MLKLAFLTGAYCYTVFLYGILGILYKESVIVSFLIYFTLGIYFYFKSKNKFFKFKEIKNYTKLLIFLILCQVFVNLIGVLGPELSFDALWYHLTLPKIFLENHKIFHINGGILYYSDMPKNIEMLYVFALSIGNEITAKFIHFLFGLASAAALYKLTRRYLTRELSLLSVIVFYSSLVVGWQSITAYVDLGTTFFTILSIAEFLNWKERRSDKHLIFLSILTGLTISTKITSLILIPIFAILIFFVNKEKKKYVHNLRDIVLFLSLTLLIASPWFLFSYINTGNPFFPLFSKGFSVSYNLDLINFLRQIFFPDDPINPIYVIVLPVIFMFYKKFNQNLKYILMFAVFSLISWIVISPIGGSRLLLPYLPALSLLTVYCISIFDNKLIRRYLFFLIIIVSLFSISYRFAANLKYIPVITGLETKNKFLSENLNFSFGDFYDTDNFFEKNIKADDKVLTIGFHNLYYIDFPYADASYVKKGDKFNYIAVQNSNLPDKFSKFKEIHYNLLTGVKVYSDGGKMWEF